MDNRNADLKYYLERRLEKSTSTISHFHNPCLDLLFLFDHRPTKYCMILGFVDVYKLFRSLTSTLEVRSCRWYEIMC